MLDFTLLSHLQQERGLGTFATHCFYYAEKLCRCLCPEGGRGSKVFKLFYAHSLAPKACAARLTGDVLLPGTALSEKIIWTTIPTTNRAEDVAPPLNYGYSSRFGKL
jgi:hypothetical protein